jgi:hypothetical protein
VEISQPVKNVQKREINLITRELMSPGKSMFLLSLKNILFLSNSQVAHFSSKEF